MAEASHEKEGPDYRALFESSLGLYLVLHPDLRIAAVSNAYLEATMTRREEIVGRPVFEVFPDNPEEAGASGVRNLTASLQRVVATQKPESMPIQRYDMRQPTGEGGAFQVRYWSPRNSPVFGPDGTLEYLVHQVVDVTDFIERKESQAPPASQSGPMLIRQESEDAGIYQRAQQVDAMIAKVEAANRDLSDFAAIVSHELKAPLRAVATLAQWTKADSANKLTAESRENLQEMVKRVARMDQMINGILAYSRVGREEERVEPVPLQELIAEVVHALAPPAHVRLTLDPGLPVILGDPTRVSDIFQNLIGNAIKFGDKVQTEIRIGCKEAEGLWEFTVADNGPGIEEKHFGRIFKIFQTLAPKDKTDSTGVGLALVNRIVERAGGSVWVESRKGEGSTFHFTWPKGGPQSSKVGMPTG